MALLLSLTLVAAACGDDEDSGSDAPEDVREIDLISAIGNHIVYAPLYIARELGYYEEEGLSVNILDPGDANAAQLMIAGEGDAVTSGSTDPLIARVGGFDAVSFFEWQPKPIFALVVPEDSPIQTVEDLDGKTVGITGFQGGETPIINAILRDAGLVFGGDVEVVPVGEEIPGIAQAIKSGRIDAFGGSASDFGGLGAAGVDLRELSQPGGTAFPGAMFYTSEESLDSEPETWAGLGRAVAKGIHAWLNVEDVAEVATRNQLPEFWEDAEAAEFQLEARLPYFQPRAGETQYGVHDVEAWQLLADYLATPAPGFEPPLPEEIDASKVVTNDLIDEINDFDREEVEQEAREYVESANGG